MTTGESASSPSLTASLRNIPVEKTDNAGNWDAGQDKYDLVTSPPIQVKTLRLTWNGAVAKGLSVTFHDGKGAINIGDWNNPKLEFSALQLAEADTLQDVSIFTREYGYGSIYGMHIITRLNPRGWVAGNVNGTPTILNVRDRAFMGVFASVNKDYFLNGLGFYINVVDTKRTS
jgi:hypothetical protein